MQGLGPQVSNMGYKGCKDREGVDYAKYRDNYDSIFGKKTNGNSNIINSKESSKKIIRKGKCSTNKTTSRYYTDI
jgi:hypothetical protein